MTTPNILARHIDQPDGPRHRCVLLDPQRLRCLDCQHTIVLPTGPSTPASTSTSSIPLNLHDPAACPAHAGQPAGACGPCRSEHLEAGPETGPARPNGAPMPRDFRQQVHTARTNR